MPPERPSGQTVPAHIRKMGKRYDFLREELQRLARSHSSLGALSAVEEETPRSAEIAGADPAATNSRGEASAEHRNEIDEDRIDDPMIALYLA